MEKVVVSRADSKRKFYVIEGRKPPVKKKVSELRKIIIILLLIFTQYTFCKSDFFLIREISVRGVNYIPVEKIVSEADIVEKNIWKIIFSSTTSGVADRIEAMPWVREVKLRFELPDRIIIYVQERTPMAVVKTGEKYYYIDDEGVIVSPISSLEGLGLPLIRSLDESEIVLGQKLNISHLDKLLHCLEFYDGEILEEFPSVEFNKEGKLSLYSTDNIEFKMGDSEGLAEKLSLAPSVLEMIREKKLEVRFVDMRYKNYVLKLKNGPKEDKGKNNSEVSLSEEE